MTRRRARGSYVLEPPARPMRRHVIAAISYRTETIECSCGAVVTAAVDEVFHERHQPLCDAWAEHRRAVGERPLSWSQVITNHRAYS